MFVEDGKKPGQLPPLTGHNNDRQSTETNRSQNEELTESGSQIQSELQSNEKDDVQVEHDKTHQEESSGNLIDNGVHIL